MALTGALYKQTIDALLSGFPTYSELSKMVQYHLNENLEVIVGASALGDVAFGLVRWAESRGRLRELVAGARAARPGNAAITAVSDALGLDEQAGERAGAQSAPGAPPPPMVRRQLRDALCLLYPGSRQASIVLRDVGIDLARLDLSGAPLEVWYLAIDETEKQGQLDALVRRALEDYPQSQQLRNAAALLGITG